MSDESQSGKASEVAKRRPPNAGKGRRPGSKNKWGADLQRTILRSLDKVGGSRYLERMAEEQPVAYMALLGKCVPREMRAEITAELTIRQEIRKNLVDSLVELMRQPVAEVIDVTPSRIAHEPSEPVEPQEPKERIPGSEENAALEEREAERAESERASGVSKRVTDEAITRLSVEANQGRTYVSKVAPAPAREP